MIYVAIIPSLIWVALLLSIWVMLAYQAYWRVRVRHRAMNGLMAVMGLHGLAGSVTAISTSAYAIGRFPCLMGYYGMWVSAGVAIVELALLLYLSRFWPRSEGGRRVWFSGWVWMWLAFNLTALLAFVRSSVLCTV